MDITILSKYVACMPEIKDSLVREIVITMTASSIHEVLEEAHYEKGKAGQISKAIRKSLHEKILNYPLPGMILQAYMGTLKEQANILNIYIDRHFNIYIDRHFNSSYEHLILTSKQSNAVTDTGPHYSIQEFRANGGYR